MKYIYIYIILTLSFLLPFNLEAKDLKGDVRCKSSDAPISEAVIQVSLTDGIMTTLTDSTGSFTIQIPDGLKQVQLTCSHLSYHTLMTELSVDSLTHIFMQPKDVVLDEVTVKADWIYTKDGNRIVSVPAMPGIDKLQADQALRNIPGVVQIDKGSYTLNGKNATIYINGIKQNISGGSLDAFLSGLPAGSIASIELVAVNAGSYSSSVEAVIDIHLDDKVPLGYLIQPSVSSSMQDSRHDESKTGLFFMGKWGSALLHSTLSYSYGQSRSHSLDSLVLFNTEKLTSRTDMRGDGHVLNYQGSLKQQLDNDDSFQTDVFIYNDFGNSTSDWWTGRNLSGERRKDRSDLYNLALSYHIPASKKLFNGIASYSLSYGGRHADTGSPSVGVTTVSGTLDMEGWMHNLSADFKTIFGDWTLRYGMSLDYNHVWDKTLYKGYGTEGWLSVFTGREWLSSVYMLAKCRLNSWLCVQSGLRFENTSYKYSDNAGTEQAVSHTDFFPSLLFYGDLQNWYIVAGASSQTIRPNYEYMLPGLHRINDYMVKKGNPDIVPTNIYRLLFYNTFFNSLQLNLEYIYIKDALGTLHSYHDGLLYQSYGNLCNTHYYEANLSVPFTFFDNKLTGQLQSQVIYKNIASLNDNAVIPDGRHKDQWLAKFNASANYMPSERLYLYAAATYAPRQVATYFYNKERFSLDAGLSYSFLKDRSLTAGFQIDGLFGFDHRSVQYFLDNRQYHFVRNMGPVFELSLRWKFGRGQRVEEEYNDYTPRTSRF